MSDSELAQLRQEILHLFSTMEGFRRELASIGEPKSKEERFERMTDQLDAIVKGTEDATETILTSVETIAETLDGQRAKLAEADDSAWLDTIDTQMQEIFQACAFQDLTGQRITKVVESLKFIDEKIYSLVQLWGQTGLLDQAGAQETKESVPVGERLEGPALNGEGVSQGDIDKMFD